MSVRGVRLVCEWAPRRSIIDEGSACGACGSVLSEHACEDLRGRVSGSEVVKSRAAVAVAVVNLLFAEKTTHPLLGRHGWPSAARLAGSGAGADAHVLLEPGTLVQKKHIYVRVYKSVFGARPIWEWGISRHSCQASRAVPRHSRRLF